MSPTVAGHIFAGRFPVYSFMYTLRLFMRLNSVKKEDVDAFVDLVAGRGFSIRDIDLLANGYFKGSEDFRQQIAAGNIAWAIDRLKKAIPVESKCTKIEQDTIKMLEITLKYMQKLTIRCRDDGFKTDAFFAQANLLSGGIIRQLDLFARAMGDFYDHTRLDEPSNQSCQNLPLKVRIIFTFPLESTPTSSRTLEFSSCCKFLENFLLLMAMS